MCDNKFTTFRYFKKYWQNLHVTHDTLNVPCWNCTKVPRNLNVYIYQYICKFICVMINLNLKIMVLRYLKMCYNKVGLKYHGSSIPQKNEYMNNTGSAWDISIMNHGSYIRQYEYISQLKKPWFLDTPCVIIKFDLYVNMSVSNTIVLGYLKYVSW